jgi:hypothetical protein
MAHFLSRFGPADRWKETKLSAGARPLRYYEYWVTGRGGFPVDMLRYDCAWPAGSDDAAKMAWGPGPGLRSFKLHSYRPPTVDRWSSFGWSVSPEEFKP